MSATPEVWRWTRGLWLIERALIPIEDYSLLNLFTDLLINEQLGHDLRGAAGRGLPLLPTARRPGNATRCSPSI